MVGLRFVFSALFAASFASVASAQPTEAVGVDQTARSLKRAFSAGNYRAAAEALARAVVLRSRSDEKKFAPLLRTVALGIRHKDESIAILAVKTLGKLKVPGSSRYLNGLLAVPKRPRLWHLRMAAIEAAGLLHERGSVAKLDKLLAHPRTEFAVAAAHALAGYAGSKKPARIELVRRLANTLGRFEQQRTGSAATLRHLKAVRAKLLETLRTLAGEPALADANSARAWVRKQEATLRVT